MKNEKSLKQGFTLTELLVICGILVLLAATALPAIFSFQTSSNFQQAGLKISSALRLVRSKTIASEQDSRWGVYFSTSSDQIVIFKGASYSERDVLADQVYSLASGASLSQADFNGQNEVVFSKITGLPSNSGLVIIEKTKSPDKTKVIYLNDAGLVSFVNQVVTDEERLKDSRHIHLEYSRFIDTLTESIILTFNDSIVETIPIIDNLEAGQFYWSGSVEVDGENQLITIKTHQLNEPATVFSIHRDRRYNNKSLKIDISGDAASSPQLINYQADGLTAPGNSSFVSSPLWQ